MKKIGAVSEAPERLKSCKSSVNHSHPRTSDTQPPHPDSPYTFTVTDFRAGSFGIRVSPAECQGVLRQLGKWKSQHKTPYKPIHV